MHQPRKRFGQHFLHDQSVIGRIVAAIGPQSADRMLEIGPGLGAITLPLLRQLDTLHAVEIDRDAITHLRKVTADDPRLVIHSGDVLKFQLTSLPPGGPWRVVGNLPYNISTPLLFHLIEQREQVQDMHFMLQKEVVDRMGAAPGSKVYGRLSVMLQAVCRVEPLFDVPPTAFRPPPKVDSSVVRLLPRPANEVGIVDPPLFETVVRESFGLAPDREPS